MCKRKDTRGNAQAGEAAQDAVHTQEWYTFKYLDFNCTRRLSLYFALKLLSKKFDILRKMHHMT